MLITTSWFFVCLNNWALLLCQCRDRVRRTVRPTWCRQWRVAGSPCRVTSAPALAPGTVSTSSSGTGRTRELPFTGERDFSSWCFPIFIKIFVSAMTREQEIQATRDFGQNQKPLVKEPSSRWTNLLQCCQSRISPRKMEACTPAGNIAIALLSKFSRYFKFIKISL